MRFNLSSLMRPVRVLIGLCLCALISLSYALPAYSATSAPTEGETNLLGIERKAQEAVLEKPYGIEKEQKETAPGLNVAQGAADADKMRTPENSQDVESIEQKIEKNLEKITGAK